MRQSDNQADRRVLEGLRRMEVQTVQAIVSTSPCRELRDYVRAFAQRVMDSAAGEVVQPVPASLEPVLEFDFYNSPLIEYDTGNNETAYPISIVGPHTCRRCCIRLTGPVESFGIFFQPLGLWQLFQMPLSLLVNQHYTGQDVFGKGMKQLWERMGECTSFPERVELVEEYLLLRAANIFERSAVMTSAIAIFRQHGGARIRELANDTALSVRQFERRFSEEMGMPPKLFARITRYQMALDAKVTAPERSWLKIAHEFGYHDQMHMIKDFQDLSGSSPGRTLMQLGDMRPEALAAAQGG